MVTVSRGFCFNHSKWKVTRKNLLTFISLALEETGAMFPPVFFKETYTVKINLLQGSESKLQNSK